MHLKRVRDPPHTPHGFLKQPSLLATNVAKREKGGKKQKASMASPPSFGEAHNSHYPPALFANRSPLEVALVGYAPCIAYACAAKLSTRPSPLPSLASLEKAGLGRLP